ncbi:MAG: WYL domain-containing transcriptional regulator [Firmicutes bacterium]|nr:WYL domain-containing transcriptional regulator [Bacillota bacterium]
MAVTTDKSNMLCILNILKEYTDENHIVSTSEIIDKMELLYMRKVDRRTVYGCIDALEEFGYEISTYADNKKGYMLLSRDFTIAEIRLLIDAIYSCEYISKKQTEELLEKLRSFLSSYERKYYSYTNIITPEKKSPNPEVFLNIEILEEAINSKKQVSFTYVDYDYDKTLKPRRERPYTVSPYAMICEGSHYYLALISQGHTEPSFYRIDMMKNIKVLEEPIEYTKREADLDSLNKVVFAHTGKPKRVMLRCKKRVLRYVIEQFGSDISIKENPDGTFDASVLTATEGLVYWALQYLQDVEVISPKDVREKVISAIKENPYGI